jgi:hypothetical protein
MKRVAVLTSVVLSLCMHTPRAAEHKPGPQSRKSSEREDTMSVINLRVADGDWGNARPSDIEAVLNAVAKELLTHFPLRQLDPVVVSPSTGDPVVLYQRGPNNEFQVHLAAKGERWAEYVYEFSHELFHILANYQYHEPSRQARNQWFEEMLCETASLYTLKQFSLKWEQSPPRSEWKSYAPTLQRFTARALNEPHRQLKANTSFVDWFQKNGPNLARNPYLREKNELVAHFFLPLLEQNPDWQAIAYLNRENSGIDASFYQYLASWYLNTPQGHRRLVSDALKVFHFGEPAVNSYVARGEPSSFNPGVENELIVGAAGRAGG